MAQLNVSFPNNPLVAGNTSRNPVLQSYVFQSGLQEPSHSSWLFDAFPQYRLASLMDKMGGFQSVAGSALRNNALTWSRLNRTRNNTTITSGFVNSGTTNTWVTTTPASGVNLGYYIVGDLLRSESGVIFRVTATGDSGGFQTVTVTKQDGTAFATGDAANGEQVGHVSTSFAPASNGPTGRIYLPDEEFNYMQIFKRGSRIGRDAFSNRIYLKEFGVLGAAGESFMFVNEKIDIQEQIKDIENNLMFGVRTPTSTRGIWDRVVTAAEGQIVNFTAATGISESDILTLAERMLRVGGSNEKLVLCGSSAMMDIQQALKQYIVNGAVSFGSFGSNLVGLDIQQYKIGPMTFNFMYYPLFDDTTVLPFVATPTATKINFRHVALALDLGSPSERLLKVHYRDGDLGPAKFVHKYINGMFSMDGSGVPTSNFDGAEYSLLSELLVEFKGADRSGALIPNS